MQVATCPAVLTKGAQLERVNRLPPRALPLRPLASTRMVLACSRGRDLATVRLSAAAVRGSGTDNAGFQPPISPAAIRSHTATSRAIRTATRRRHRQQLLTATRTHQDGVADTMLAPTPLRCRTRSRRSTPGPRLRTTLRAQPCRPRGAGMHPDRPSPGNATSSLTCCDHVECCIAMPGLTVTLCATVQPRWGDVAVWPPSLSSPHFSFISNFRVFATPNAAPASSCRVALSKLCWPCFSPRRSVSRIRSLSKA